jgi:hypothetical protein
VGRSWFLSGVDPLEKVEGVLLHNSCGLHDRSPDFGLIEVDGGDSLRGFVNSERICVYGCPAGFCQFIMYGRSVEELFPRSFHDKIDLWHETVQDAQPQDSRHK